MTKFSERDLYLLAYLKYFKEWKYDSLARYFDTTYESIRSKFRYDKVPTEKEVEQSPYFDEFENTDFDSADIIQEQSSGYIYDKDKDEYIFYLRSLDKLCRYSGESIRNLKRDYSNFSSGKSTITEVATKYGLDRKVFLEIKNIFGWTHDSSPYTREEFSEKDTNELVEDALVLQEKKFFEEVNKKHYERILSEYKKLKYKDIEFTEKIESLISSIVPITIRENKVDFSNEDGGKFSYWVSLADLHIGLFSRKSMLISGEAVDLDIVKQRMEKYKRKILEDVHRWKVNFDSCYIIDLGDMFHSLTGYTDRGTDLEDFDRVVFKGTEVFAFGFELILDFIKFMCDVFGKVEFRHVVGNHDYKADWFLVHALKQFFSSTDRVNISLNSKKIDNIVLGSSQILIHHGYELPPNMSNKKDSFIRTLFMSNSDAYYKTKYHYLIQGDQHHTEFISKNGYDFIMIPSLVADADEWSESLGMSNRPAQQALIFSYDDGLVAKHTFYLDL